METTRRSRPVVALMAAGLLLVASRCDSSTSEPAAEVSRIDLLEVLDPDQVTSEDPNWLARELGPADPALMLFEDGFNGSRQPHWVEGAWLIAADGGTELPAELPAKLQAQCMQPESESGVIVIKPATRGLHLTLPDSGSGSMYRIRARLQLSGQGEAQLVARSLDRVPRDPAPDAATRASDLQQLLAVEGRSMVRTDDERGDTRVHQLRMVPQEAPRWRTVDLLVESHRNRKGLHVMLLAQGVTLVLDHFEVRRLTPAERYMQLAFPNSDGNPWHRRLSLKQLRADVLLLPTGSTTHFDVTVPLRRPRFDAEAKVLGRLAPDDLLLRLRVDGKEVGKLEWRYKPSDDMLEPWVVPLDEYAGRKVRLTLEAVGGPGLCTALIEPRLMGVAAASRPPNLLLISVDTLRADALGCYGHTPSASPRIDALATQGTLFERVQSPASYTLPTHATMLSGQNPLVHGVHRTSQRLDGRRSELLAVRLRKEGYATAGFTGGGLVHAAFGFDRGFDRYSHSDPSEVRRALHPEIRDGKKVIRTSPADQGRVVNWLRRHQDQPFFLFVHSYLVHAYGPRRKYVERLDPARCDELMAADVTALWEQAKAGDPDATDVLRRLYLATVAQADEELVGGLLDELQALGLAENTVVAVVSDHGEQFLEHQTIGHGAGLWGELVTVPWILRGPGVEVGARVSGAVLLEDVAPTLLHLLGLEAGAGVTGRVQQHGDSEPRPGLLHMSALTDGPQHDALVEGEWKLVRSRLGDGTETIALYRFDQDALDSNNLAAEEPRRVKAMESRMNAHIKALEQLGNALGSAPGEGAELSEELKAELQALGYVLDGA